jgi:glycosyltransferase involved in cell wall biosynthesis
MRLCVMIPALNEEDTIGAVIDAIPQQIEGITQVEVVVVDDGSSDRTREIALEHGAHLISHGVNRGVGRAFQTGLQAALDLNADFLVNIDADGQFDPQKIPLIVEPLIKGRADCVTASRFKDREFWPEMSRVKFWGNRQMSRLISFLCHKKYCDVSCGFRGYNRDSMLRLNLFGDFTYTQEVILDLSFKGAIIEEVPIKIRGTREFGKSRVASNLFNYALRTGSIIFRTFRDYKPMLFFGTIALLLMIFALFLGGFVLIHYILYGSFSPHKWAGFLSLGLVLISALIFIAGMLADMMDRLRQNQEKLLYIEKKNASK